MQRTGRLGWHGAFLLAAVPLLMGARERGGGCGGGGDDGTTSPDGGGTSGAVPDVSGTWNLTFANDLTVEVDIGGEVYNPSLAAGASSVTVMHDGEPIEYQVDCSRELIVCPSELLPGTVQVTQRPLRPREISVEVSEQTCRGTVAEGQCDGTVVTETHTRNGAISDDGGSFSIVLGGGAAVAGSCALLSISLMNGDLVTEGGTANEVTNGELVTAFGGGCLLAGQADLDPGIEAAAAAASVQLRSTYTATRVR